MNRKNEIAMFAGRKLLKPKHLGIIYDNEIQNGNDGKATPIQKGLDDKPLPIRRYNEKTMGMFSFRQQEGVPKLNRNYWYEIVHQRELAGIVEKKSDAYAINNVWERAKNGVYWTGDRDENTKMLIRGDLLTQKELTDYYNNRMESVKEDVYDSELPENTVQNSAMQPMRDFAQVCKKCNSGLVDDGNGRNCKLCNNGVSDETIPYDFWDKK